MAAIAASSCLISANVSAFAGACERLLPPPLFSDDGATGGGMVMAGSLLPLLPGAAAMSEAAIAASCCDTALPGGVGFPLPPTELLAGDDHSDRLALGGAGDPLLLPFPVGGGPPEPTVAGIVP